MIRARHVIRLPELSGKPRRMVAERDENGILVQLDTMGRSLRVVADPDHIREFRNSLTVLLGER